MTLRDALKVMADGEELRQCRGTHENRCRFNVSSGHFEINIGGGDWQYATHLDPKAMYERIPAEAEDDVPPGFEAWPIVWNDGDLPYVRPPVVGSVDLASITTEHGFSGWGYRRPSDGTRMWNSVRPLWYSETTHYYYPYTGCRLVQPDWVLMQKGASDGN